MARSLWDILGSGLDEQSTLSTKSPTSLGRVSEEFLPKHLLAFEFDPNRKLAHFVIEMRNIPSALEHSAAVASKGGLNILSGFHHAPSQSRNAYWSFFADFTNAKTEPAEFADQIRSLASTLNVRFRTASSGLLVNSFHFPMIWAGKRAIAVRADVLTSIFSHVRSLLGAGPASDVLLFQMGQATGRKSFEQVCALVPRDLLGREPEIAGGLVAAAGWGILTVSHLDVSKKTVTIQLAENFECLSYPKGDKASSQFMRGFVSGAISEFFQQRLECVETKYVAKGDEYCEFTVEPVIPSQDATVAGM